MIQLTTPFNPGDADPGKSYTHVRIVHQEHEMRTARRYIGLVVARGYIENDEWVEGVEPKEGWPKVVAKDRPRHNTTEYTDLVTIQSAAGTTWFHGCGYALYQWLISTGKYPGTVYWPA